METKWLQMILDSSQNQETVLFRMHRFIEEESEIPHWLHYHDSAFGTVLEKLSLDWAEKTFYVHWLWLNEIEYEWALYNEPEDFEIVFSKEFRGKLAAADDPGKHQLLRLKAEAGEQLLKWFIRQKTEEKNEETASGPGQS